MSIIVLNLSVQSVQKSIFQIAIKEPVYCFDNEETLFQFQFLQDEQSLLYLFCDSMDESISKTLNRLRQYIPHAFITIVNQSREYEDVRSAFLSGAHDYIAIKQPVDIQSHIESHNLSSINNHSFTTQPFFETMRDRYILEGCFVEELISGSVNKMNLCINSMHQFHLEKYYCFFMVTVMLDSILDDAFRNDYEDFLRNHLDILYRYTEEYSYLYLQSLRILFYKQENSICMLCCTEEQDKEDFQGNVSIFFGRMLNRFQQHTSCTFTMSISSLYKDILFSKEAYKQALQMGEKRFYSGGGHMYFYEPLSYMHIGVDVEANKNAKEQINVALESGNQTMITRSCDDFCLLMKRQRMIREDVLIQLITLSNNFRLSADGYGYTFNDDLKSFLRKVEKIRRLSTFEQMKSYFLQHIINCVSSQSPINLRNDIQRVLQIIDSRYSDDITLESMSHLLHFNPSYFSAWFKKEIGVNFSEYLTKKRLESGKMQLIYSDKSIQQISQEVGYSVTISFNRIFKKNFNMTPSQFRKQYIAQKQEHENGLENRHSDT